MNNDHDLVTRAELDIRRISATNGERIPERPEYAAPIPLSALLVDKHTRGRPLTREEYDAELADHASALTRGTASLTMEIAAQLREEVRELEIVHRGSWDERLDAISVELLESDSNLHRIAGHLASVALLIMRGDS